MEDFAMLGDHGVKMEKLGSFLRSRKKSFRIWN